jgi:hypothetical protein
MDENDEINYEQCNEIMGAIKKAIRRRIIEIKDDLIQKYQLNDNQRDKISKIINMTKLYHPIETNKLDIVVQQND